MKTPKAKKRRAWNSSCPAPSKPIPRSTPDYSVPADLVPVGQTWLPRSALPLKQQEARRPKPIPIRKSRIVKKKRTPEEASRIYGPPEFRTWIHLQRCAVCEWHAHIEQCHAKTGGKGRKGNWKETFPGCGPHFAYRGPVIDGPVMVEGCHAEAGRIGVKSFEKKYGVVLLELAADTQRRYQAHVGSAKAGT